MVRDRFNTFMVYTTKEGGPLTVRWSSSDEYERVRATGKVRVYPHNGKPETVDVKMVALALVEDLRDFVLDPVKS